ncbi:hypothetical protein H8958_022172 [Nasalis larvatus]
MVMYIERDSRKTTPGKEQQSGNEYLSKCLDLLIPSHRAGAATNPGSSETAEDVSPPDAYSASPRNFTDNKCLQGVFLILKSHIKSIDSGETNIDGAIGLTASEEFIKITLSAFEAIIQYPILLKDYRCTVVDYILPPLVSLVQSQNVEWRLFSLRLLSETTSLLVNQEFGDGKEKASVDSDSNLLALIRDVLLPQYEHILVEPDPVPAYALKLLVAMTEHNPTFTRLVEESKLIPLIFEVTLKLENEIVRRASVLQCDELTKGSGCGSLKSGHGK